ncbi:MAG: signal peptidase I [Chloroflexi bacterium]|nr:signal peptidase I [Chloroflexota bacterium]
MEHLTPSHDNPEFDPEPEEERSAPVWTASLHRIVSELITTILPAVLLALFVMQFVAQAKVVHGRSMEPNLHTGQRLIIEKMSYRFYEPERGDIVVVDVTDSELPLIKRVIGLPGDAVKIENGAVFINGTLLNEPYLQNIKQRNYAEMIVPLGHVFVMGDNRLDSRDSRSFGPIQLKQIEGRAWISFWPLEDIGTVR